MTSSITPITPHSNGAKTTTLQDSAARHGIELCATGSQGADRPQHRRAQRGQPAGPRNPRAIYDKQASMTDARLQDSSPRR